MSTTTAQLLVSPPPSNPTVKSAPVFFEADENENSMKRPESLPASETPTTISPTSSSLKRSYPSSPQENVGRAMSKVDRFIPSPSHTNRMLETHGYLDSFKSPQNPTSGQSGSLGTPCTSPLASSQNNFHCGSLENPDVEELEFDSMKGNVTLWQFLLQLLLDRRHSEIIRWTNNAGEFVLLQPEEVARLWGLRKDNNHRMNYDKLSRALRYYYQKNIIRKVQGHKFVYQFIGLNKLKRIPLLETLPEGPAVEQHLDQTIKSTIKRRQPVDRTSPECKNGIIQNSSSQSPSYLLSCSRAGNMAFTRRTSFEPPKPRIPKLNPFKISHSESETGLSSNPPFNFPLYASCSNSSSTSPFSWNLPNASKVPSLPIPPFSAASLSQSPTPATRDFDKLSPRNGVFASPTSTWNDTSEKNLNTIASIACKEVVQVLLKKYYNPQVQQNNKMSPKLHMPSPPCHLRSPSPNCQCSCHNVRSEWEPSSPAICNSDRWNAWSELRKATCRSHQSPPLIPTLPSHHQISPNHPSTDHQSFLHYQRHMANMSRLKEQIQLLSGDEQGKLSGMTPRPKDNHCPSEDGKVEESNGQIGKDGKNYIWMPIQVDLIRKFMSMLSENTQLPLSQQSPRTSEGVPNSGCV